MQKNIYLILFNLCLFFNAFPQSHQEVLNYADSLLLAGRYTESEQEYLRVLFFNISDLELNLHRKLAFCALGNKQYKKAMRYYDTALTLCNIDSVIVEIALEKCKVNILFKNFEAALADLYIFRHTFNTLQKETLILYKGIIFFGLQQYDKALEYFLPLIPENDTIRQEKLKAVLTNNKLLKRPSPVLAKTLSMFIPGAGQVYAGNVADGLNSLVLSGSFVAIGLAMYKTYGLFDVILAVSTWSFRYYTGGVKNAQTQAYTKLTNRRNHAFNTVLKILNE